MPARTAGKARCSRADVARTVRTEPVGQAWPRAAWPQHQGQRDLAFVDASEAYCPLVAVDVASMAIRLHGGNGYMAELHIEKLARDAKLLEPGASTTHIDSLTAARALLGLDS